MTSLRETVAAQREQAESQPDAGAVASLTAFGPPDPAEILKIIGLDPRNPLAHAVVAVAERYGLDPVLGHIQIIRGSQMPYITRDGYLAIAHRSGQLDGIEVVEGPRRDTAEREWAASVAVYRKDMGHPFVYPGRADLGRDNGPEMAISRAERRALRRAFAVTVPAGFADAWDDIGPGPGPESAPPSAPGEPVGEAGEPMARGQLKAMMAAFREAGITGKAEQLATISGWLGRPVTSRNDLTQAEASAVLARLAERRRDAETASQPDPEQPPSSAADAPAADGLRQPSPAADEGGASMDLRRAIIEGLERLGLRGKLEALAQLQQWLGHEITSTSVLTPEEGRRVLAIINQEIAAQEGANGEDGESDADD